MLFYYLTIIIIRGCIWGFATKIIIENKGYDDNWFWWGFFFGIIALIVACARPDCYINTGKFVQPMSNVDRIKVQKVQEQERNEDTLAAGGWQCLCGRVHASYVSSCSCGKSKFEAQNGRQKAAEEKAQEEAEKAAENMDEMGKISLLKEYKELMDGGVITPEEFEAKKKQLLGI